MAAKIAVIGAAHSNRPWRKTFSKNTFCMIAMGLLLPAAIVDAQQPAAASSADSNSAAINAANNPTTPKLTFEAQDYWMPSVYGLGGRDGSLGLQRNLIPITTFGVQNIFHVILPVVTNPSPPEGTQTGLGGLQLYNLSLAHSRGTTYGLGPLVVLPTESNSSSGPEKWQAGFSGAVISSPHWGLAGALFTYQHAFGRGSGPDSQQETLQPLLHYNFPGGFYSRSTALWSFNSGSKINDIPIGLGGGKVWKKFSNGKTINLYVEPQYSVWHSGVGVPRWQLFTGVNFQFPYGLKLWSK
jgi:hypothetical protein